MSGTMAEKELVNRRHAANLTYLTWFYFNLFANIWNR